MNLLIPRSRLLLASLKDRTEVKSMQVLLPEDSPLRNPPADLDPVQKASWDAVRFALDMTHVSYLRLVAVLEQIGHAHREGRKASDEPTIALVDAWSVVDNLWRLHNVLRNFRGLKRSPELEVHLRAIAAVEDLRHGIQHLHENFATRAADKQPILGSLSWFWTPDEPLEGGFMIAIAAGAIREGWIPLTNPIGRQFHRPVGLVTLAAFGKELELTGLVVRAVEIAKGLDRGARNAVKHSSPGGADIVMVATVSFKTPTPTVPAIAAPAGTP